MTQEDLLKKKILDAKKNIVKTQINEKQIEVNKKIDNKEKIVPKVKKTSEKKTSK